MEKATEGQVIEGKFRALNNRFFIPFATKMTDYRGNIDHIKIDYKTVEDVK
ncbi:hypothetical protein ACFO3D_13270 [Virgibacillus kekensis]|uniref:Uncharacterized protein n=1 Tax=Virgibacillus kekensis TaxID=202261 RepID=A0ABV9DM46_9BACI